MNIYRRLPLTGADQRKGTGRIPDADGSHKIRRIYKIELPKCLTEMTNGFLNEYGVTADIEFRAILRPKDKPMLLRTRTGSIIYTSRFPTQKWQAKEKAYASLSITTISRGETIT